MNSGMKERMEQLAKQTNIKVGDDSPTYDYGKYCDHTVVRGYTSRDIVKKFCDEGKEYNVFAVCVTPIHAKFVKEQLKGTDIKTCISIGFPLGANKPQTKAFEARLAIEDGADEVEMVINVGALRDKNYELVYEDIKGVVDVGAELGAVVKVIIETCYLSNYEKIMAVILCELAGADYIKTSTGMGTGNATVEDIYLIGNVIKRIGSKMKIKASGGIETQKQAEKMLFAGADRLGLSKAKQVVTGDDAAVSASSENQPPKFV